MRERETVSESERGRKSEGVEEMSIKVHSRSVDPRKLCVGVKYYIVHMYSMPYYTYGSTANLLDLEPTALILYQKNGAVTRINVVLENLKFNE